ncbi:MAG: hypothetical protein AMXMBFR84_19550 [Candidatus Hydrogenedentota bacterium]
MRKPIAVGLLVFLSCITARATVFHGITVWTDAGASRLEQQYAALLKNQAARKTSVPCEVKVYRGEPFSPDMAHIILGRPTDFAYLAGQFDKLRIPFPTAGDPGAEGFHIQQVIDSVPVLLAAGADELGVLYACGEVLRQITFLPNEISLPDQLRIRTAPAFEVRGTEVSQGATMRQLTGAREWTGDEWKQAVLEYVLAGANTIAGGHVNKDGETAFDWYKSLGLKTLTSYSPNGGSGPEEWTAKEAIGRKGHLCPSVPEARAHLLEQAEAHFKGSPTFDYIRFYSGDGGGCECERCAPYGKTYIHMCEAIAAIIHKYHPTTQIFATNQKLDNAGDIAIFEYLQAEPRSWLRAFCYGPGSNAMGWMPGRRQDHRMDLFRFPAFGPMDRYLREIVHQLPPANDLVFFTDLTHWVYSQYGLMDHELIPDRDYNVPPHWGHELYDMHPDPAMLQVYDRRTFHARPRNYYHVFQQTMRYGIGDVTYSEGHHDHFNQWMWQRLMWSPHTSLDEVIGEYCRYYFGPDAAPFMAQAVLQLEENLSTPIAENPGIDKLTVLLKDAALRISPENMKSNYLWREYMQRALTDQYIRSDMQQQYNLKTQVEGICARGIQTGDFDSAIVQATELMAGLNETPAMAALKTEIEQLGDESEAIFGVRGTGLYNLAQDYVGLGWMKRQLGIAADAGEERKQESLRQIAYYEDPGPGGFYDDAGNPEKSPNLVYGWPYGEGGVSDTNRKSQRTFAFTTDEKNGVTFQYRALDPKAAYRIRFTLGRPRYLPRFAAFQKQTSQSIYADNVPLVENLELPEYETAFFEYDIPQNATADGVLNIVFRKQPGVGEGLPSDVSIWRNTGGWGTLVAEAWLMKVN